MAPPASWHGGLRWSGRHCQSQPEQADDGPDQALGLAQRQAEHGLEREGCQDGERRVPGLPAWSGALRCAPARDHLVREPDREAPTLVQGRVVGGRVGDPAFLSWDVTAAVVVQLEGQGGLPRSGQGQASYVSPPCGATGYLRATC